MTSGEHTRRRPEGSATASNSAGHGSSRGPAYDTASSTREPNQHRPLPADPRLEFFQGRGIKERSRPSVSEERPTLGAVESRPAERIELRHYIDILRRRWAWFLLPVVAVTGLAAVLNLRSPEMFSASASVLVNASEAGQVVGDATRNAGISARQIENEIAFADSDIVRSLAEESLADLDGSVSVTGSEDADLLEFTAEAGDPLTAAEAANAWATAFVTAKQEQAIASTEGLTQSFRERLATLSDERQSLRSELDRIEDQLARASDPIRIAQLDLERTREERRIAFELDLIDAEVRAITGGITELQINGELVATGEYQIIQVAAPPTAPLNLPLPQSLAFGIVAGLIIGAGSAFLRNSLDQRIKSVEDVRTLGLTALGTIPQVKQRMNKNRLAVLSLEDAEHPIAIAYHRLRTVLEFSSSTRHFTSVLVTSPSQSEGKTTTAINLAGSFALGGDFTAVLEADLRRPRFAEVYGIPYHVGVTSYLAGQLGFEDLATHPTAEDNLVVVSAGPLPANATTTITHPAFKDMLDLIEKDADVVVIDSPPVLPVPDALDLAHMVDGVLLVARSGVTKSSDLLAAHENLQSVSANVLGVVLTHAKDKTAQYRYEEDRQQAVSSVQRVRSMFASLWR